ncbi:hypothetical protein B0H16DRAFT_1462423 [Mycena metata]|uniref:Uncharacterized protein n=1 Tax=Mycena metata TaxID=1033252 RepID=A0AAD7N5Q4_9AGAR|nr:hypothetical protein B0H16DRAFT_1462423 [Mycena metata]
MGKTGTHTRTRVSYPSRPPSADNNGTFACALPLHTHKGFTDLATHDRNKRRHWHLLKHPRRPGVFSDRLSLASYLKELRDPNYQIDDDDNEDKISKHDGVLALARAQYKFCIAQHNHPISPTQRTKIKQIQPPTKLQDLLVYDPSDHDARSKLDLLNLRMGSPFEYKYYEGDVWSSPSAPPDTISSHSTSSSSKGTQAKHARSSQSAPSSPTSPHSTKQTQHGPTEGHKHARPDRHAKAADATTAPKAAKAPNTGKGRNAAKAVFSSAPAVDTSTYFYFSDGRVCFTLEEAEEARRAHPAPMTIVASLAEVVALFEADRANAGQ